MITTKALRMPKRIGNWILGLLLLFFSFPSVAALPQLNFGYYVSPDYFEFESLTGRYSGFLFDYVESLSNYAGRRFIYKQCDFNHCTDFLTSGQVDVIPVVVSNKNQELPYDLVPTPVSKAAVFLGLRHGRASLYSSKPQRVGFVKSSQSEPKLRAALVEKGFRNIRNLEFVGFDDSSNMFESYKNGDLEGMVIEALRRSVNLPIVAELFDADVYLAVRKGNEALKIMLQNSMMRMHTSDPMLENILNSKYFLSGEPLILTDEELNYLNRRQVIKAVATSGQAPYSFFENGHHRGLIADIAKIFERDLGIKFEVLESQNEFEMNEMLSHGQADILFDLYSDYNCARLYNMRMTSPYLSVDYVPITRDGRIPEKPKVAVLYGTFFTSEYMEELYQRDNITYYSSLVDCLHAVASGSADVTFMKSLVAQTQIELSGHRGLRTSGTAVFSHQIAVGVNANRDPILVRILNKEIAHIDKRSLRMLSNEIEFESLRRGSLIDLVYSYPLRSIGIIAVPLLFIIALLTYLVFERRRSFRTIRRIYYTNVKTGLHNGRWFEERIPKVIEKLNSGVFVGTPFVMVLAIKHTDILEKNYESCHLLEAERNWIIKCRENFPWILECAVAVDLEGIYILGLLKQKALIESLMQDFERAEKLFAIGGVAVNIRTVCGICMLKSGTRTNMSNVIVSAQMARDDAMSRGQSYVVYTDALEQVKLKHKRIEDLMEKGLENNEFEVWIQPKYAIRSRRVIGGEALVRWRSPEMGFMQPGEFVPLFEKNAFVIELDYYMLSKVRTIQQARSRDGKLCVPISVNQSGLHFSEDNYLSRMKELADSIPLPDGLLELEVTESAFFDITSRDPHRNASNIMQKLREMGYTFSMDDFSKGYSSMSSLLMLPMDTVKIDMDMLNAAMASDRARTIFAGVVKLCKSVDMKVICEGVENAEQEKMLLSTGCNYGQGYMFSKPLPMNLFLNMLDRQQASLSRHQSQKMS